MEQGFCGRGIVEVAFLEEEDKVGDKPGTTGDMLAELHVFIGKEIEPTESQAGYEDCQQDGIDSSDTPAVEVPEAEGAFGKLGVDDGGNQETGNDKEDINTDEAAFEDRYLGERVEDEDSEDCQCTKAIDVGTPANGGFFSDGIGR